MNFAQGEGDLRSRYRRQPRQITHAPTRNRSSIHLRPHAHKIKSVKRPLAVQDMPMAYAHKEEVAATPSAMFALAARGYKKDFKSTSLRVPVRGSNVATNPSAQKVIETPRTTAKKTEAYSSKADEQSAFKFELNTSAVLGIKNMFIKVVHKMLGVQKIKKPQAALLGAASFVFIFGIAVSIMGWRANTHVEAQAAQIQKQSTGAAVETETDETEVNQKTIRDYTVPADHPKRITIPKTKTYARILSMGLKNGNQLDAPKNIFDTGWYDRSAKPGSGGGAVLIDGHVHGKRKKGVFYNLKTLVAGDQIKIERGDGQIVTYEVVKTQSYPQNNVDMTAAMLPIVNGKEGLNIITCHGDLNGAAYEERLVVFAVRIS